MLLLLIVSNKAKGRILKRVLQENKARQIFRKTNISFPLIRTRMCVYQGVRNVCFSENLARFVFALGFALLPYCRRYMLHLLSLLGQIGKLNHELNSVK